MSSVIVVGTQWGDEGKGKITDFFSKQSDIVARYQGGDNAGHTIEFDDRKFELHLVPSGIFAEDKLSVITNGVVVNPVSLVEELEELEAEEIDTSSLRISDRAHVVFDYHILMDQLQEKQKGSDSIGTTARGIGPAYMDKAARIGIRMIDLLDKDVFKFMLEKNIHEKNILFKHLYNSDVTLSFEEYFERYYELGQKLSKYVCNTSLLINDALEEDKKVLYEGAQGVMLDLDHGTYPFVTSSNASGGGVTAGAGVGPTTINAVIGVSKAYSSRVGSGPFPTELHDDIGKRIQEIGREFEEHTGRARRVGWLDTVVMRHARRVSGLTHLALNSIDVLSGLDTVKLCIAYEDENGEPTDSYPANLETLKRMTPIYEEMPGWDEDISTIKDVNDLPENAKNYVKRVSELVGCPLTTVSVGPNRDQTILVENIW